MSPQIGFNLLKYYLNFQHSKKQQRYKFLNIFMNLLKPSLSTNGCNRLVGYSCKKCHHWRDFTEWLKHLMNYYRWEQTVNIWVHGYTVVAYSIDTNSMILSHVVHVKLEQHNRPHIPPFSSVFVPATYCTGVVFTYVAMYVFLNESLLPMYS